jgi:hypothetical protein
MLLRRASCVPAIAIESPGKVRVPWKVRLTRIIINSGRSDVSPSPLSTLLHAWPNPPGRVSTALLLPAPLSCHCRLDITPSLLHCHVLFDGPVARARRSQCLQLPTTRPSSRASRLPLPASVLRDSSEPTCWPKRCRLRPQTLDPYIRTRPKQTQALE